MLIDNGWYLILENITCGYGNHAWYIELISLVACGHSWYKFNISLVITITTRDIFQYQIPAIIYLPIFQQVLKSISPDYWVRTWEKVPWWAILNICLCCELSQNYAVVWFHLVEKIQMFGIPKKLLHFHYCTFPPNSIAIMQ